MAAGSVPAVYGITEARTSSLPANAVALLGLRALYVVLQGALSKPAFIGVKLVLH